MAHFPGRPSRLPEDWVAHGTSRTLNTLANLSLYGFFVKRSHKMGGQVGHKFGFGWWVGNVSTLSGPGLHSLLSVFALGLRLKHFMFSRSLREFFADLPGKPWAAPNDPAEREAVNRADFGRVAPL